MTFRIGTQSSIQFCLLKALLQDGENPQNFAVSGAKLHFPENTFLGRVGPGSVTQCGAATSRAKCGIAAHVQLALSGSRPGDKPA